MAQLGNKWNAILNGEWGGKVKGFMKRFTSGRRRAFGRGIIDEQLSDTPRLRMRG